jgi:hypothetical protein
MYTYVVNVKSYQFDQFGGVMFYIRRVKHTWK